MIKAKFRDKLRSTDKRAQINELPLKKFEVELGLIYLIRSNI